VSRLSLIGLCVLLGFALVADTGCMKCGSDLSQKIAEKAVEKGIEGATGGKLKVDAGGDVDISGLPEMLRYPGAKALGRWSMSGDKGTGATYTFETADPKQAVVAFYKKALAGWKSSAEMESEGNTMLVYVSSDEKESAAITIGTEDAKTTLNIIYSKKQ
jgi:hypothetical protein